jgi:uncharacterized protein YbcI
MSESLEFASRGDLEAAISRAVISFEKEFMGRGPVEVRTYLLGDLVVIRLKGVLTPAEQRLAKSKSPRSSYLLKQVRNELLDCGRPMLEAVLNDILNARVQSIHTDISTKSDERVIVVSLEEKLDFLSGDSRAHDDVLRNGRLPKDQLSRS